MPVNFKQYERDADDKYDEGWRRYGDTGAELNKGTGLRSITISTDADNNNTLMITGDSSAKSDGYVAKNIKVLLDAAGINTVMDSRGSMVSFKAGKVGADALIKAAEALSGKEVDSFYPMLDASVAKEIVSGEKKLVGEALIQSVTGKAPATGGRGDV